MDRKVSLIVAIDMNGGIGNNGTIPWNLTEDMAFFQDVTTRQYEKGMTNVIIMGKNTWLSIPEKFRSLTNRITIVVSSTLKQEDLENENKTKAETYIVPTLNSALELCNEKNLKQIFICGGKKIYDEAMRTLSFQNIYLTKIKNSYACDTHIDMSLLEELILKSHLSFNRKLTLLDTKNNSEVKVSFRCLTSKLDKNNQEEMNYLNIIETILNQGHRRQTRNAITFSTFGECLKFDLKNGFPLLTTKKVFFRGVFEELLFFLRGDTNTKHLSDKGVKIWEPNTSREFLNSMGFRHYEEGDMGAMYGQQLKHFNAKYYGMNYDYTGQGIDQIKYCIDLLKKDPYSRRIVMTTYNPEQAFQGVLFPCHGLTILFNVEEGHRLSCMMTQRSADYICGVPFNIASYALLIHMICEVINNDGSYTGDKFIPGRLIMNFGDTHIYEEHKQAALKQLLRTPYQFPQMKIKKQMKELTDIVFEDIELENYTSYPILSVKMVA